MANRTMQAKELKHKKQRRLFPKKFAADYIPVGNGPDRFVIRDYKMRNKSLAFDAKYMEYLEKRTRFAGVPSGRFAAEQLSELLRTMEEKVQFVNLRPRHPFYQTLMFFNSERTFYMIYEEDYRRQTVSCSIRYQFRQNCLDDWKADKTRWASVTPLAQSPPP